MSEPLKVDGFDKAIIGEEYFSGRLVYSAERMMKILMNRDGMSFEEALEFMEYNIIGAYVGEMTPIYISDIVEF
tara:strand:- start:292 stop:513 length:222 start_codon:yes stop_codon:yes gene_type:complete